MDELVEELEHGPEADRQVVAVIAVAKDRVEPGQRGRLRGLGTGPGGREAGLQGDQPVQALRDVVVAGLQHVRDLGAEVEAVRLGHHGRGRRPHGAGHPAYVQAPLLQLAGEHGAGVQRGVPAAVVVDDEGAHR